MKTLADFKRALEVGSMWLAHNHRYNSSFGVRKLAEVKSTKFGFENVNKDGSVTVSWCDFPKACNIEFVDGGEVKIYVQWAVDERFHLLSYWKV